MRPSSGRIVLVCQLGIVAELDGRIKQTINTCACTQTVLTVIKSAQSRQLMEGVGVSTHVELSCVSGKNSFEVTDQKFLPLQLNRTDPRN
jgi:hypothetical protein